MMFLSEIMELFNQTILIGLLYMWIQTCLFKFTNLETMLFAKTTFEGFGHKMR